MEFFHTLPINKEDRCEKLSRDNLTLGKSKVKEQNVFWSNGDWKNCKLLQVQAPWQQNQLELRLGKHVIICH